MCFLDLAYRENVTTMQILLKTEKQTTTTLAKMQDTFI